MGVTEEEATVVEGLEVVDGVVEMEVAAPVAARVGAVTAAAH